MTRARPLFLKLLLSLGVLLFLGAGAEIIVRALGEWDRSGNFYFKNRLVAPLRMPVEVVAANAAALRRSNASIVVPHDILGWTPRPGSRSADGLYRYNAQGLRSVADTFAVSPPAGVLRIALFGDSFTHGDDVAYEHTFGAVLQDRLARTGTPAEVLNFAVGGYGIDQALLRYREHGAALAPDVVVLGFAPENLKRNLNLVRPLYDPRSGLPFAKPRFILQDGGIGLINVPVPAPERLVEILRRFDDWDLRPHEYFYDPADFRGAWWQTSKLLAVFARQATGGRDPWLMKRIVFTEGGEEQRVGWAVISAFAQEATARGARFLIVHLPSHPEMELRTRLGRWTYQSFLDALDGRFEVVHPEAGLLAAARGGRWQEIFAGHFNPAGNRIIAEALYAHLAD